MSILDFLLIYLTPTIPAVIVFLFFKPSQMHAALEGTFLGLSVKIGGGLGCYVIFLLLSLHFAKDYIQPERPINITIQMQGDLTMIRELVSHVDSLAVVLSDGNGSDEVRFERFAVANGGRVLNASREVRAELVGRQFRPSIVSSAEGISVDLIRDQADGNEKVASSRANDVTVRLDAQTTISVLIKAKSDDPLLTDADILSTRDWVLALSLISHRFGVEKNSPISPASVNGTASSSKTSYDLQYALVFTNETDVPLSEIVLTDSEPSALKAPPSVIEAIARRMSIDEYRATVLELRRSRHPLAKDGPEVVKIIEGIISRLGSEGTEVGFIKLANGVHQEGARSGILSLRANNTTFRIGPFVQAIPPGDAVILVVKSHYPQYWEDVSSGKQDWFGQRVPYPTRLTITTIESDRDDLLFDDNSIITDFAMPDGTHVLNPPLLELKVSSRILAFYAGLLNKGEREKFLWSYK